MQFTIALAATLFVSAINAVPISGSSDTIPNITISLINDRTGANAQATVRGDGLARNIPDLFRGTAIDQNGQYLATSAQLIGFTEHTRCFFQNYNWIINLNGKDLTYVDIDGDKTKATPINMDGFNLQCV
ncbi:hypothetical protein B0J11DRAFT_562232 [Dendryphion nanum]|uniref:Uncharacterized protein n=1 Tax=Dendryphion nanum TaxID=256645 RepID=A0A9P9IAV7_9PLEO|nr:hypothetical protein B0J11DRAFT_562232 [Dendryphion nanum]